MRRRRIRYRLRRRGISRRIRRRLYVKLSRGGYRI